MIEQVAIDYPGGREVRVGQVEEGSRDPVAGGGSTP